MEACGCGCGFIGRLEEWEIMYCPENDRRSSEVIKHFRDELKRIDGHPCRKPVRVLIDGEYVCIVIECEESDDVLS